MSAARDTARDARDAVASNRLWYHTMELAPGVVTPGWFDLRPMLERLPWPDVRGKRCLDVGTYDGQLAFELERRGASEVVATDIADHELWDWPERLRSRGPDYLRQVAGPQKGSGFEIARDILGSSVERRMISVYDLRPETIGTFDVVVCGSLMLHLRDPLRALAAIRSVCLERFLSIEQVQLSTSVLCPRRPVVFFDGLTTLVQWWLPNAAAHRRMVEAAGFDIEEDGRVHCEPFGVAHPPVGGSPRARLTSAAKRVLTGNDGVPHHAIRARPAPVASSSAVEESYDGRDRR